MNYDMLETFRSGRMTEKVIINALITSVAGGVYSYMVMLRIADRKVESNFFEAIREEVFMIRDSFNDDKIEGLSERMSAVYGRLETARTYLYAHKPEESGLLQSVNNNACGLIHTLKHYVVK